MATSPKNDAPPPGRSRPKSQSPPPPPIEYQYMYETNKSPTKLLDALLRAISRYIICEIGDKDVGQLTPDKLAAFYKAVGGDYDSLFVDMPTASISYIWQVTGCQHTLQPTEDDFAPPSIPALTPRGFSRWESLEILLGPEEHVPFLQYAVKKWNLKHPETGQEFPPDLPASVFPTVPDDAVDRWHKSCADKLRQEASKEREAAASSGPEPEQQEPKVAYSHVRKPFQNRARPADSAYFERPVSYNHVPGRQPGGGRVPNRTSPERYHEERERNMDDQARRRSFSDYNASKRHEPPTYTRGSSYLDPNMTKRPEPGRRPSQPRHSSSDSEDEPIPPRTARRHDNSPPCPPPRFPDGPGRQQSPPSVYRHRSDLRSDEERRRPGPSPSFREKISEKVSNILPNGIGPDRPRNPPRPSSYNEPPRPRRNRENPPSRLSRSYSDLESNASSDPDDSEDEYQWRKTNSREDRDVDRDRMRDNRGRPRGGTDRDDDRREQRYPRRPEVGRRTSSHADMDRRRDYPPWEPRNREQMREDRKRWDKRGLHDERGISPMSGGSGRRYPEASHA